MTTDPTRHRPRWRRPTAVLAVASLAAVALLAVPAQAQVTECRDDIREDEFIPGSVLVPAGAFCVLINVSVGGGADVGASADLLMMDRTTVGAVTAGTNAFVSAERGSVIADGLTLNQSFGGVLENSMVFDGVQVNGSEFVGNTLFFTDSTNIVGGVRSVAGWTGLQNGFVNGNVDTLRDLETILLAMRIAGAGQGSGPLDVQVSGVKVRNTTQDGSVVCDTAIDGDLDIRGGQGGVIQIGGPFPKPTCLGNQLSGDLELHSNTKQEIQVSGNVIFEDANCTNNSPSPVGHGNTIFGTASGQCANLGRVQDGLVPPPGAPGEEEAVSVRERIALLAGPLRDRRADVLDELNVGSR